MAISQIPGYSLVTSLDRQGVDLSFISSTNTNPNGLGSTLLYLDYANWTIGINEPNPYKYGQSLVVAGNILSNGGGHFTTGNLQYDLGNVTNQWRNIWAGNLYGTIQTTNQPYITTLGNLSALTVTGTLNSTGVLYATNFVANGIINAANNRIMYLGTPTVATDAATKAYVDTQVVIAANVAANTIPLFSPTINGGNLQANAAYLGFTTSTYVTDAIDILNSVAENLFTNTFVRTVTFSSNVTAGGAGQTILLTMVPQGNVNQYVINWGDGTGSTTTSSSTATHTYSTNSGSPYTITVTATNTGGAGPSNSATNSIPNYIIIYGANPAMSFNLYRTNVGGTVLSGNNLYVIQGNPIYLQNTTTNTNTSVVTWSVTWGDGSVSNVANNSVAGGVLGSNIAYTYNGNSGSGQWGVNLALLTDNLANPAIIPMYSNVALKVYGNAVSPPAGLNTKVLNGLGSSTGFSPYLAALATDNTGGSTLVPGTLVQRATYNQTTINTLGNVTSSYTYNANAGILSAVINGVIRGNVNLATQTTSVVTGNLGVIAFSDYNLLTSAGAATTFASSTYYPGLYYGFEANIISSGSQLPVGINRVAINHSITGATPNIEFVVDNITTTPTVSTGTTIAGTNGTYRYISGIPYYNTGSPTVIIGNIVVGPNWIGQTYFGATPIVLNSGQNKEGTASALFTGASTYTYSQISNSSATMLSGGVPIANTGATSGYTLNPLTISNFQTGVRTIANVLIAINTVNSWSNVFTTSNIQLHSAAQTGISEIAISANTSANTNPAVRSSYFLSATTHTPSYISSTNFMSSGNVYTESADPGVAGTREATIRLGVLGFNANNYSTGYLPVGPNRSGDGASFQYFTMAFNRTGISGFNLNLIAPAGIAGLWVAAPGTTIDSTSTLNGWLTATTSYAGAGVPGANTGAGGNGSNGCGVGSLIAANVALNGTYAVTLGTVSLSSATNNMALIRIALASGQTVTTLAVS